MRSIHLIAIALCSVLPVASRGQILITNPPPTEIENFEQQNDVVIVKGFDDIGSFTTDAGVVSVRCKESDNVESGHRLYGISVNLQVNQDRTHLVIDDDEMDGLIHGLDFLGKVSYSVTTMPAFDASFTTRSGLRITAHSERRNGGIELSLQFGGLVKVPLSAYQFTQFQSLIEQAKTDLDAAKGKNSSP